jgi:hypothetical protein
MINSSSFQRGGRGRQPCEGAWEEAETLTGTARLALPGALQANTTHL